MCDSSDSSSSSDSDCKSHSELETNKAFLETNKARDHNQKNYEKRKFLDYNLNKTNYIRLTERNPKTVFGKGFPHHNYILTMDSFMKIINKKFQNYFLFDLVDKYTRTGFSPHQIRIPARRKFSQGMLELYTLSLLRDTELPTNYLSDHFKYLLVNSDTEDYFIDPNNISFTLPEHSKTSITTFRGLAKLVSTIDKEYLFNLIETKIENIPFEHKCTVRRILYEVAYNTECIIAYLKYLHLTPRPEYIGYLIHHNKIKSEILHNPLFKKILTKQGNFYLTQVNEFGAPMYPGYPSYLITFSTSLFWAFNTVMSKLKYSGYTEKTLNPELDQIITNLFDGKLYAGHNIRMELTISKSLGKKIGTHQICTHV